MQFKHIAPIVALVCAVSAPLHAEDAISLTKELLNTVAEMNTQLDTIKDQASATAAAPAISKLMDKMTEIQNKMLKATPPTNAEALQQAAAIQTQAQEVQQKFQANMMRIAQGGMMSPELAQALQPKQPVTPPAAPAAAQ